MGGGAAKAHEAFPVTPAVALADPPHLIQPVAAPATVAPAHTEPATGEVLTPVPEAPPCGLATGVPVLVGGADLEDSTATLVAYQSTDGPREVLLATVTADAEAKLLEALALSPQKLIPIQLDKEVTGRLPIDESQQLWEQLLTVVKSTNHHLKAGDGIPTHTHDNLAALHTSLAAIATDPAATDAEKAMAAHYQAAADQVAQRLTPGYNLPYAAGGKVPPVAPYETAGVVTVTEHVPAPAEDPPAGLLAAQVRDATRIKPALGADGTVAWDGKARAKAAGKEYVVDLGDGYRAVYRPRAATSDSAGDFSQRGTLEVLAPPGAGHGAALVDRLGQLNLVNRPMTATEGEWTYLSANIAAQANLATHPAVKAAKAEADGLEDAVEQLLFAQRAHQGIGLDEPQLVAFARQIRLDAETRALPHKVAILRGAVAAAAGLPDGDTLAAHPGYQPQPRRSGGWLTWDRFDVTANTDAFRKAFAGRGLSHRVSGANLAEIIRTGGVLASTERRRRMGVAKGKGVSEGADMHTDGARSVFLRVAKAPGHGPTLHWDDPTVLLRRADWYAYDGDHYGSLNPKSGHSTKGLTRDPHKVAAFTSTSNEVCFRDGIDLLGHEAPSHIHCSSAAERKEVLALLADKGVTHLAARPIQEVVQC